jgi:hypothetical protein
MNIYFFFILPNQQRARSDFCFDFVHGQTMVVWESTSCGSQRDISARAAACSPKTAQISTGARSSTILRDSFIDGVEAWETDSLECEVLTCIDVIEYTERDRVLRIISQAPAADSASAHDWLSEALHRSAAGDGPCTYRAHDRLYHIHRFRWNRLLRRLVSEKDAATLVMLLAGEGKSNHFDIFVSQKRTHRRRPMDRVPAAHRHVGAVPDRRLCH